MNRTGAFALALAVLVLALGIFAKTGGSLGGPSAGAPLPHAWPPKTGAPYPGLQLQNQHGELVKLEDFRGRVIVVKPIGMACPACNAFAGAATRGGFRGASHQQDLLGGEQIFRDYGGVDLGAEGVVVVHLLLYDMSSSRAPTVEDAKAWADHWGIASRPNYGMVPGFQLIDKNFVLRSDSSGHHPQDNLYTDLAPMVASLLGE